MTDQPWGAAGPGMGTGDCDEAVHRLYHYLDGQLTPERRADVRRHLDECAPCFKAFDFEAEVRVLIQQRCRDEVPTGLHERIAQAIHHTATTGE